jgi:hypothetical protein
VPVNITRPRNVLVDCHGTQRRLGGVPISGSKSTELVLSGNARHRCSEWPARRPRYLHCMSLRAAFRRSACEHVSSVRFSGPVALTNTLDLGITQFHASFLTCGPFEWTEAGLGPGTLGDDVFSRYPEPHILDGVRVFHSLRSVDRTRTAAASSSTPSRCRTLRLISRWATRSPRVQ